MAFAFFWLCLQTDSVRGELVLNKRENGEFNPGPYLCYESIFSLLAIGEFGETRSKGEAERWNSFLKEAQLFVFG